MQIEPNPSFRIFHVRVRVDHYSKPLKYAVDNIVTHEEFIAIWANKYLHLWYKAEGWSYFRH